MKSAIVILYTIIIIISSITLSFVVKFFRDKAKSNNFVRNQILIDLALWAGLFVVHFATVIIAREIFGQFYTPFFVDLVYYIQQSLFECVLVCIVSLQFFQVLSIFLTSALSEWREEVLVCIHRLFVLTLGVPFGILVCHSEGGICRSTSIYEYLLQSAIKREELENSFLSVISVVVFAVITITCQIAVELKRYLINREDRKTERLAVEALKGMSKTREKMNTDLDLEQGISHLSASVRLAWVKQTEHNLLDPGESSKATQAKSSMQQVVKFKNSDIALKLYFQDFSVKR